MNSYSWCIFVLVHIVCIAADSESDIKFGISSRKLTDHDEFPFQASIRKKNTDAHLCGGAILNNWLILTTASCVHSEVPEFIYAILGKTERYDERQRQDIEQITEHEMFDWTTHVNDIALLRTAQEIYFAYQIQPMVLQPSYTSENFYLQVVGWNPSDDTMQHQDTSLVSCDDSFDGSICATNDGFDLDAASLLFEQNWIRNYSLVGILARKGNGDGPDVYTRIKSFETWIEEHSKLEEGSGSRSRSRSPVKITLIVLFSIVITGLIIALLVKCKKRRNVQRHAQQPTKSMQTVPSISNDYTMPVAKLVSINSGGPMHYVPTKPPSALYPTAATPVSPPPPSYEHLFTTKPQ